MFAPSSAISYQIWRNYTNIWFWDFSASSVCIFHHITGNFSWNGGRKRLVRVRIGWICAYVGIRLTYALCLMSAAEVHSLLLWCTADWNGDFRVNGQGDCCLLHVSAVVTRSANRSRRRCRCPRQAMQELNVFKTTKIRRKETLIFNRDYFVRRLCSYLN